MLKLKDIVWGEIDFVDENANGIPDSEENGDYGPSTILDWTGAGD